MDYVNLFTATGNKLERVASVKIVHFQTRPEVIIWGIRVFTWNQGFQEYVEAFAVSVLGAMRDIQ